MQTSIRPVLEPRMRFVHLFLCLSFLLPTTAWAGSSDFDIRLKNNTPREQAAAAQLRRMLDTYEVSDHIFTYSVMINEYDAPHSHPILTINAVYLDDDNSAFSIFLHEQLHWLGSVLTPNMNAAIEDLKILYPNVPGPRRGGAVNAFSTYAHLIVGVQEFDVMARLVGEAEAERVLRKKPNYRWVYGEVLKNKQAFRDIAAKHNLNP